MRAQQARAGVELWEVGEPLGFASCCAGVSLPQPSGEGGPGTVRPPSTGSSPHSQRPPVSPAAATTSSSSSSSTTCSNFSSSSSSSCSSSASAGESAVDPATTAAPSGLDHPCLHGTLSDPGYESAHLADEEELVHHLCRLHHHDNPYALHIPSSISSGEATVTPEGSESAMSLRERSGLSSSHRDAAASPLHQGLTRSRSFGGLLSHRRSHSQASSNISCSSSGGGHRSSWANSVLGQAAGSPRDVRRVWSLPPHVKVPKAPRPERATLMTGAVARGLRESAHVTRADLDALREAHNDPTSQQQIKSAERYLTKIEYHLSKVEDLQDEYALHQKLREGVRTMAYAYALSPGKDTASALTNVRSGYRECTETLCALEVQIEQRIGTFMLQMKGIQGFARLCPGDVFEVSLKHGTQKWKSRGRVCKDNSQTWDSQRTVMKALIGEMLVVKAVEVRVLGKTVQIGSKVCETKDLFSPYPQLMTVNLNPSGSLKLNVVVTWNPLDGVLEDSLIRTPSTSATSPSSKRRPPILHSISSSPTPSAPCVPSGKDGLSPECDHDSSFGSMSARSSTADSASPMSEYRGLLSSSHALSHRTDSNSPVSDYQGLSRRTDSQDSILFDGRDSASPQCDNTGNFTLVRKKESRVEQWARYSQFSISQGSNMDMMSRSFSHLSYSTGLSPALSQSLSHQLDLLGADPDPRWGEVHWDASSSPNTLHEVVSRLCACLEDIQGQFSQLHALEEAVLELDDMCKKSQSRRDSDTSEISLSVESALECFDFLNAECDEEPEEDQSQIVEKCVEELSSPCMATEGCISVQQQYETPSPITGQSQLDTLLFIHLRCALQLIQHLGAFGPLKTREKFSLAHLEQEGQLIAKILTHRHNFSALLPQHIISIPHVQVLWDTVSDGEEWCVKSDVVVKRLLPLVSNMVDNEKENLPERVLKELVRQMTMRGEYASEEMVTVAHFVQHLHHPLHNVISKIQTDIELGHLLLASNKESIEKGLSLMKAPTAEHIRMLVHLLGGPQEISSLVNTFIEGLRNNNELMHHIVDECLMLLESSQTSDREAACVLFGHLVPTFSSPPSPSAGTAKDAKTQQSADVKSKHISASISMSDKLEWPHPVQVLSFVQQNDDSERVRDAARQTLLRLGSEGELALKQVQLSKHGFQGVQVKERTKM
ncbi:rho family-interacting cell polarization regulator 2-like isoform X2 [Oratosquilla oratoria]|uniref:rho family-interacting cell polarization regulator 2-like isoform X2 n=1 Tax=Oratosquilla oratoria TaxID=337810 RepID=UPI003F772A58